MMRDSFVSGKKTSLIFSLLFLFLWNMEGRSQLIDYSSLAKQSIHFHLDDLLSLSTPGVKISYQYQIKNKRFLGLELGYLDDINRAFVSTTNDQIGIQGFHLGLNFQKAQPHGTLDFEQWGMGFHYSLRIREFKSWIYINDYSYLEQLTYDQLENHFGLYLKWNKNKRYPNGFSYSFGINPGIVMEFINANLPQNSNVFENNELGLARSFVIQKESGIYFRPDIFFEFCLGLTLVR
jgi:hypothetical protein